MDAKVVLCDFAEVSGGKLFISGAGLALLASGTPAPPFRVNITLAILGLINPADTDLQHKMTIELVHTGPAWRPVSCSPMSCPRVATRPTGA